MFVYVTHKELIAIFLRKNISQVETSPAMSRLMYMITDGFDIIVYETVYILFALLVINTALNNMKEMGDHTTSGKALPHIVEIEAPGIG